MFNDETWTITFVTDPPLPQFPFTRREMNPNTDVFLHPRFDPELLHKGFDLAIIDLVPENCNSLYQANLQQLDSLTRYDIFRELDGSDLAETEIVGYGLTGIGINGEQFPGDGLKRNGRNRFEALADEMNGAVPSIPYEDPPNIVPAGYVSPPGSQLALDFDGQVVGECQQLPGEATSCDAFGVYLNRFNSGFEAEEVDYGVGDSGGPNFVNGKIAGVTSYRLYPTLVTDLDPGEADLANFGEVGVAMRAAYKANPPVNCNGSPNLNGHQDWIDCVVDIKAPRVQGVTIGTSLNNHADWVVPSGYNPAGQPGCMLTGCNVKALQLRTVPVALPNEISVTFSESVIVELNDLTVESARNGAIFPPTSVNFNPGTLTATWTFATPIGPANGADQLILTLSGITDQAGVRLDGEWINPLTTTATNGSMFPSGNGSPDGTNGFEFYVTLVSADFNQDNRVNNADFTIWNANKFNVVQWEGDGFKKGDATGDNFTDGLDFDRWNALKFTFWTTWPESDPPQNATGGGGGGTSSPSAAWMLAYTRLLDRYQIYQGTNINQSLSNSDWERFADELMALLARI